MDIFFSATELWLCVNNSLTIDENVIIREERDAWGIVRETRRAARSAYRGRRGPVTTVTSPAPAPPPRNQTQPINID